MLSLQVNSSAFSPNGQKLLTAAEDGCVYGWDTQSGRLLWRHRWGSSPQTGRLRPMALLWRSTVPTTMTSDI